MDIIDLLHRVKLEGATLTEIKGDIVLSLKKEKKTLDPILLNQIKENKIEILNFLKANKSKKRINTRIINSEKREYYKPTSIQDRFYSMQKIDNKSIAYNILSAIEINGIFDYKKFSVALNRIINQNDILRGFFIEHEEKTYIKILDKVEFQLECKPLKSKKVEDVIREFNKPIDLKSWPLYRLDLYNVSDSKSVFLFNFHHSIIDGFSLNLFIEQLIFLYQKGQVKPSKTQYIDLLSAQSKKEYQALLDHNNNFWEQRFSGELPVLDIPTDFPRPPIKDTKGNIIEFKLERSDFNLLNETMKSTETTLNMILIACYNILLHKYTEQEDIIIGVVSSGREHSDVKDLIGLLIETTPFRNFPEPNKTIGLFIQEVKKCIISSFDNQPYPFEKIMRLPSNKKDFSRNPIFDTMLIVQNLDQAKADVEGLEIKQLITNKIESKLDIEINVSEENNSLFFSVKYRTSLFKQKTIERFNTGFLNIIKLVSSIAKDREILNRKLKEINILDKDEKFKILNSFNNKTEPYTDKNYIELLTNTTRNCKDRVALEDNNSYLTYGQLHERSDEISNLLAYTYNIKEGDFVGVMLSPENEMIITILSILKLGAIYVPISLEFPELRIKEIAKDCSLKLIVVENVTGINGKFSEVLKSELFDNKLKVPQNLNYKITPHVNPAYLFYTSGSTGRPKGVLVSHSSLVDYALTFKNYFSLNNNDIVIQQASIAFDTSIEEIFPILLSGGKILILKHGARDIDEIVKAIKIRQSNILSSVPLVIKELNNISNSIVGLKALISGGDVLKANYINNLIGQNSVYDTYGPTETTVCATYKKINSLNDEGNIGEPIRNRNIIILDTNNNLSLIGLRGEICIGGTGVAIGYLNQPELTADKFVNNPFDKNEIIYKTGDTGCWREDGNIRFLGRKDSQIKLRGIRIELGEIEKCLEKYPEIKDAVVTLNGESVEDTRLIGYFTSEKELDPVKIRKYLLEKLPAYMVPHILIALDEFKKAATGKIDKKKLPLPEIKTDNIYIAPRNEVEEKLLEIWNEILGIDKEKISVTDNFFDIGGFSLKGTQLIYKMHQVFDKKLEFKEIFTHSTIEEQAWLLNKKGIKQYELIKRVTEQEYYELSVSQKRLWILSQLEGGSLAYNMPFTFELKGELNLEVFKKSIDGLTIRHESLRTIFEEVDGEPKQRIISQSDLKNVFKFIDLSKDRSAIQKAQTILKEETQSVFDLSSGPLIKIILIQLSEKHYLLKYILHHIISDSWSMGVILKDLLTMYDAYAKGIRQPLQPLNIQYKEYVAWQNKQHAEEYISGHRDYWKKQFEGEIPVLDFPADRLRPKVQTYNGDQISFEVPEFLTRKIKNLCQIEDITMFMALLGFVKTLLYRYTNQNDIVIGIPVAGRQHAGLEDQVGFYVNTLALRTSFEENTSFRGLLEKVKKVTLDAYEYQDYGFGSLVEGLNIVRNLSRSPLFDIMVVLQNTEINNTNLPTIKKLEVLPYESSHVVSKFDITFNFVEQGSTIRCDIEYNTDLFDINRLKRLSGHLLNIIEKTTITPTIRINEFDILTSEEREELLYAFNDTYVDYPKDKTVIGLFEDSVRKSPDNVALVYEGKRLTYKEFHQKVLSLSGDIQGRGIKQDDIVAIIADRSIEMVMAIYAIMKSSAAYLPIDPNYPSERITYILKDSETKLIITNTPEIINNLITSDSIILNKSANDNWQHIIDLTTFKYHNQPVSYKTINSANDLAYVIYTSGSTGKPKGVMLEQHSLTNITRCLQKKYLLTEENTFLFKTTFTFDVSIAELFGWFWEGGKLAILKKEGEKDIDSIITTIQKEKVTHINFVPSMFLVFIEGLDEKSEKIESLKYIFLAGEALSGNLVRKFKEFNTNIVLENIYGPTEACIYASGYSLGNWTNEEPVYIGKPLDNIKLFITNKNNQLQPKGVSGELIIGGEGIARGYLKNDEFNQTKFVVNPITGDKGKVYKTGDLVRYGENGNIEYQGRLDSQVKVRGFRIELGEIEKCMEEISGISEVVVNVIGESSENKRIIGYYISRTKIDKIKIETSLSEKLPSYMIPDYYILIDEFPKTISGKIDRKKLPLPEIERSRELKAASNEVEEKLIAIWSEVLGIEKDKISVDNNFFELGGHSLKAMKLRSILHKEFNIKFQLNDIFANPRIEQLAELFQKEAESENYFLLNSVSKKDYYCTTFNQRRLWYVSKIAPFSTTQNVLTVFNLNIQLDLDIFKKTMNTLIDRHEAFRTNFILVNDELRQIIKDEIDIDYDFHDLENSCGKLQEIESLIIQIRGQHFDLGNDKLFTASLIKIEKANWQLAFVAHHIITDGWSNKILEDDFLTIYRDLSLGTPVSLEPLIIQYKDYAEYFNRTVTSEVLEINRNYWYSVFESQFPLFELPKDEPYKNGLKNSGAVYQYFIGKKVFNEIKKLSQKEAVSLYMILLSGLFILLHKLSGKNDLVISCPYSDREEENLKTVVGYFITPLLLRMQINKNDCYIDFLVEVKRVLMNSIKHQHYPLEKLIEELNIEFDYSKYPLTPVSFNMLTFNNINNSPEDIIPVHFEDNREMVEYELDIQVTEYSDNLRFSFIYRNELFKKSNIENLASNYTRIIEQIVENKKQKIKDIMNIIHDI